jgi:protein-disulfide isomerase
MNKKAEIRARRKRNKVSQWIVPGIIVLVGLGLIAGIVFYNVRNSTKEVVVPIAVTRPNAVDNATGDPKAPVTVIALEDFQCPYCGIYSQGQEPKIIEKYVTTGKVYYKFVPFSFLGSESVAAAKASYCAMDQKKFWEYHDYLYANQNGENQGGFNKDRLQAFAEKMGLNMNDFNSCLDTNKYSQKVMDDVTFAKNAGATGSPYFLVNDKLVSVDQLEASIDAALQGK